MILLFGKKEKKLEKLDRCKRNAISMIGYYETELKKMETKAAKNSFSSESDYERYVQNLKDNLLKQHDKLIDIYHEEELLKKEDSI